MRACHLYLYKEYNLHHLDFLFFLSQIIHSVFNDLIPQLIFAATL